MTNPKYRTQEHRAARRRLVELPIARQGYVNCVTCGTRITNPSQADAGHDDTDPAGRAYIGAQCWSCNRGDGGRNGAQVANNRRTKIKPPPNRQDHGW